MPYREVWVDEDDIKDFHDDDLVEELERRGYIAMRKGTSEDILFKIKQSYIIDSPDDFRKFIEQFLKDHGHHV